MQLLSCFFDFKDVGNDEDVGLRGELCRILFIVIDSYSFTKRQQHASKMQTKLWNKKVYFDSKPKPNIAMDKKKYHILNLQGYGNGGM